VHAAGRLANPEVAVAAAARTDETGVSRK
jgi:hypothetical protein